MSRRAAGVAGRRARRQHADLYGQAGDCKSGAQASCFDENRWTAASAISIPPFAFQNRPTFQQVIELARTLGR